MYVKEVVSEEQVKEELLELHPFEDLHIESIRDVTEEEKAGLAQYRKELH